MIKGDLVSCRLQYGDEAMVKKGKAILKQTGAGIFVYSVLGLLGAFDSYYRGADMGFTACIAVCVIAFIILGAIVSFIRKNTIIENIMHIYAYLFHWDLRYK